MKTKHLFTYDIRPGHLFNIPNCPDNVMFDLTWKCNYRCSFCYISHEDRKIRHPPWKVTEAILHKLAEWGVREVLYLGGEPMIHPKFDEVIELGSRLGLSQRVVTNGSRINERRARLLADHDVEVGVSLHSANASVHNHLTGNRQGFRKGIETLSLLIKSGTRCFVQFSPTRSDPIGLFDLAKLLSVRCGDAIQFIDVNRLLPFGEAAQDKAQAVLNANGWWNVLKIVGELVLSGWTVRVESVPHCWVRDRAASDGLPNENVEAILSTLRPCYMGINQLSFDPTGRVKLCPGGSSVSDSILNLKIQEFWHSNPLIRNRRDLMFLPRQCIDFGSSRFCLHFSECNGGCRSSNSSGQEVDPLLSFNASILTVGE